MRVKDIIRQESDIPQKEAELLLSFILNCSREKIIVHDYKSLTYLQLKKYQKLKKYRLQGYSIASLIKHKYFYGLKFKVNTRVLIPRPESEIFLEELKKHEFKNQAILDIGTGSGCLIISFMKYITQDPSNTYIATDIDTSCLKLAQKNAKLHHISNLNFYTGNLLNSKRLLKKLQPYSQVTILANLPYLTETDFQNSETIKKEPKQALIADQNGLAYYYQLIDQVISLPKPGLILMEIKPDQREELMNYIKSRTNNSLVETIQDLSYKNRILKVYLNQ